ncbi:hypothetical protein D3C72_2291860 [compost metagenome]
MENGTEIHIDQKVDILRISLKELLRPVDAGIVHKNVELHLVCKIGNCSAIGNVDRVRYAAGAFGEFIQGAGAAGNRVDFNVFAAKPLDDSGTDTG